MCGIVGILASSKVADGILDILGRLEYRGYDSAGIATLSDGQIDRRRAEGKLQNLSALLKERPLEGSLGIGHTRWATHGRPSVNNAHPHMSRKVAVVHNGIVENFAELRADLTDAGHVFSTETDTETIVHLLTYHLDRGMGPLEATAETIQRLRGAFAIAAIFSEQQDLLVGVQSGAPLVLGYGEGGTYVSSDSTALKGYATQICALEHGDWVAARRGGVAIYNDRTPVVRPVHALSGSLAAPSKGDYPHFMLKEIAEQPGAVRESLRSFFSPTERDTQLAPFVDQLNGLSRLSVVACGSAYYAGLVAKYWLEQIARLPVDVEIASEFRYRTPPLNPHGATLVISQSGETADTLAALRYAKEQGQKVLALVNVPDSTICREASAALCTKAGPEIGVASTKAFTTQLALLGAVSIAVACARGTVDGSRANELRAALHEIPMVVAQVLRQGSRLRQLASEIADARDMLFLGRGSLYPIALEGALKLKELSYIHAEGYPAGEMKHGPIALIDDRVPVVALSPSNYLFDKMLSNVQEAHARGGKIIAFTDADGVAKLREISEVVIELPTVDHFVAPILYALPMQLLAYHAADIRGTDVDQPRNLAKSVTVE